MGEHHQTLCPICERLLAILDEDLPSSTAAQQKQLEVLLDLEEAARAAHVEPWLISEIQTARETTGWLILDGLDDEIGQ